MTDARRIDVLAGDIDQDSANEIAQCLRSGGIIIYPTDTLYAVGCDARNADALARLRAAKGREGDKAFPVIAASIEDARALCTDWPEVADRLAAAFWPGPLTIVMAAAAHLPPELLAGAPGVAVRVPDSGIARALAALVGPLVSTSANLAGAPPCVTVEAALAAFPDAVLAIDAGPLDGAPSTIVDVTEAPGRPRVRVLREGRVPRSVVDSALARDPDPSRRALLGV